MKKFIAGLSFLIVFFAFAVGAESIYRLIKYERVTGVITSVSTHRWERGSSDDDYTKLDVSVGYDYEVDGKTYHGHYKYTNTYEGTSYSDDDLTTDEKEGDEIEICCNPDDPYESYASDRQSLGVLACLAGGTIFAVYGVNALRYKKDADSNDAN